MVSLNIHHKTTYLFSQPVTLWPHRLLLRPRESRELRLISSNVDVTPAAALSWAQDVFGNTIATASFHATSDHLVIDSTATIELDAAAWPVFPVAPSAIFYPFSYEDDEFADLGTLAIPQYPDPTGRLQAWAQAFVWSNPTDTLSAAQRPERRDLRTDRLPEPGQRRYADAGRDARPRLGVMPGFRGPVRGGGAHARIRFEYRLRLSL